MKLYRRLDRAWARGEAALTVSLLIAMVLIAGFSAGIRNLTRFDIAWANTLLTDIEWADSFQRKATLQLAFLGASQAVYYHKHISMDAITRMLPLRPRYVVHTIASAVTALIMFALAVSLAAAVELNLSERPIEYEILGDQGSLHVCDATPQQLGELEGLERPSMFCAFRAAMIRVGVQTETPGAAIHLIVPFLFLVMGGRFAGNAIASGIALLQGAAALEELESEARARLAAVHASLRGHTS